MKQTNTWIIIPTYNEAENITALLDLLVALPSSALPQGMNLHFLVVDDQSPDGTAQLVKKYQKTKKNKNVHLLVREGKRGRGLAGIAGFQYALQQGADYLLEMDADFSHEPKSVPELINACLKYDVVLGSRFVEGGKTVQRPWYRNAITFFANHYIRFFLGLSIKDCNSGFRCFKRKVLEDINLKTLTSEGPSIVQEILYKAFLKGFSLTEVPIIFKERQEGASKMGFRSLYKGYLMVLTLRIQKMLGKL